MTPQFLEIHIENTNSCGYKCVMCPRDKHTRKLGFMPLEDLSLVLERIGSFNGHFHLHGFGEPLLDRKLPAKVKLVKEKFPEGRTQIISTLGVAHAPEYFQNIIQSGLDDLIVSFYGFTKEQYQSVHGFNGFDRAKQNLETLSRLKAKSLQIFVRVPAKKVFSSLPMADEREPFMQWVRDLGLKVGEIPSLHNFGNGRNYNRPSERMCPVVDGNRKNILNITWDLNVIPCCFDYNASIPFGNLRTQSLDEIFNSPEYFQFLISHQTDELSSYPICQNCEKMDYL
ncbi:MAG: SPASM domain-containing protein [Parachlamydiales bacterium]|nr:SPASM domain-containing protein [Parachlamydiales bacterium]